MGIKIAIAGEIRSGKNTVSDYITKQLPNIKELYFAEGIAEIIEKYFPEAWYGKGKPRYFYQEIGQFMRGLNNDVWVKHVNRKYEDFLQIGLENFICTDLRQQNEYDWLKSEGFQVIKVETDSEVRIERIEQSGDVFNMQDLLHPVEMQIRNLPYDYLITNNTTLENLYEQIDFVLDDLKKEGGN